MPPLDAINPQALLPAGVQRSQLWRCAGGQVGALEADVLADEVPVALVFNGLSQLVMLATPADLEDFALGFGLTEGLLESPDELYGCEAKAAEQGIELHLEVSSACFARLKAQRRNLAGRTGCGLCGSESLAQLRKPLPSVAALHVAPRAIAAALAEIPALQTRQQLTGAIHAAAWCLPDGQVGLLREDVGRHNALDKLIGALLRAGRDPREGFVCITSRASFEMVQKTARAGMGMLVAVSAPTALAVDLARAAGVALAGFARGDQLAIYNLPERFGAAA